MSIRTQEWAIRQKYNAMVTFDIDGILKASGNSLLEALQSDYTRGESVAYTLWEKQRDFKAELEWAIESLGDRRLEEAREEWAADRLHPDIFCASWTPSWDSEYPTPESLDIDERDIQREAEDNAEFEINEIFSEFNRAKTADQAIEALYLEHAVIVVDSVTCTYCAEQFDWHFRHCDFCDECMCPHCDPELVKCKCWEEDQPWKPHDRLYARMLKRAQNRRYNSISAKTSASTTSEEEDCMDGS